MNDVATAEPTALAILNLDPTIGLLRELFVYDPSAGVIRNRVTHGPRAKAGDVAGSLTDGYVRIKFNKRSHRAHRIAWALTYGTWPSADIDHINGNGADNRLANLRDVPRPINTSNVRRARASNKSCGLLGVTRNGKRWKAQIRANGQHFHLGTFDTPDVAHAAYVAAKRIHHPGCQQP